MSGGRKQGSELAAATTERIVRSLREQGATVNPERVRRDVERVLTERDRKEK
jgi:hypothetical protein